VIDLLARRASLARLRERGQIPAGGADRGTRPATSVASGARSRRLRDRGASPEVGVDPISSLAARPREPDPRLAQYDVQLLDFIGTHFAIDAGRAHTGRPTPRARLIRLANWIQIQFAAALAGTPA